jgi:hypothetical protein
VSDRDRLVLEALAMASEAAEDHRLEETRRGHFVLAGEWLRKREAFAALRAKLSSS